jgi:hypothetical protein
MWQYQFSVYSLLISPDFTPDIRSDLDPLARGTLGTKNLPAVLKFSYIVCSKITMDETVVLTILQSMLNVERYSEHLRLPGHNTKIILNLVALCQSETST